jgi:hypothetical protein
MRAQAANYRAPDTRKHTHSHTLIKTGTPQRSPFKKATTTSTGLQWGESTANPGGRLRSQKSADCKGTHNAHVHAPAWPPGPPPLAQLRSPALSPRALGVPPACLPGGPSPTDGAPTPTVSPPPPGPPPLPRPTTPPPNSKPLPPPVLAICFECRPRPPSLVAMERCRRASVCASSGAGRGTGSLRDDPNGKKWGEIAA